MDGDKKTIFARMENEWSVKPPQAISRWLYLLGFLLLVLVFWAFPKGLAKLPIPKANYEIWSFSDPRFALKAREIRGGPDGYVYKNIRVYNQQDTIWLDDEKLFNLDRSIKQLNSLLVDGQLLFHLITYTPQGKDTLLIKLPTTK
jgi:hypothetical protein